MVYLTGKPKGYDEIWVIGDTHFLAKAKHSFEQLKESDNFNNQGTRHKTLHLMEQYEVQFSQCHYSWAFTTQIKGGLAHLLSTNWKLPNFIYVMFSNDQVLECDVLGDEIYKVLEDLFSFINRALIERKTKLPKKAKRYKATQVIIVKTVAKSQDLLNTDNFKNRRRSLNRALQRTAINFNWTAINVDAIIPTNPGHFDDNGDELSQSGFRHFWEFLSTHLKTLDSPDSPTKLHWRDNKRPMYQPPFNNTMVE